VNTSIKVNNSMKIKPDKIKDLTGSIWILKNNFGFIDSILFLSKNRLRHFNNEIVPTYFEGTYNVKFDTLFIDFFNDNLEEQNNEINKSIITTKYKMILKDMKFYVVYVSHKSGKSFVEIENTYYKHFENYVKLK